MSVQNIDRRTQRASSLLYSPKKRFSILPRRPWTLPEVEFQLEPPDPAPSAPASTNWLTLLLPPLLMAGSMGIYALMFRGNNLWMMLPMVLMGLGFPIANIFGNISARKKYEQALEARRQAYLRYLEEERQRIEALARRQYQVFHQEYPDVEHLKEWVLTDKKNPRLWWRSFQDRDFLSLRVGTGKVKPVFNIIPPNFSDNKDPLRELTLRLVEDYRWVEGLPILIDLKRAGSLVIRGEQSQSTLEVTYRLLVDIVVHHAPQDVEIVILDTRTDIATQQWAWAKWLPHVFVLEPQPGRPHLAFDRRKVDQVLEWVMAEFYRRQRHSRMTGQSTSFQNYTALVVLVGEDSILRRSSDIAQLAREGHEFNIYVLFVGGRGVPRECRAQLRIKNNKFEYMETWAVEESPAVLRGTVETISQREIEKISRALAPLEPASFQTQNTLPDKVSLFEVLEVASTEEEAIYQNLLNHWINLLPPTKLLQFPFGVYRDRRQGIRPIYINLLPEDFGGIGAYHSILVGTTGSGKSEFMKTLVLAAAYRYSPKQLNFFFMDFKGGAAFNVFKRLPHTVGIVTNLSPDLVERGLDAIEFELERRQHLLAQTNVSNIWEYNASHATQMPHLLLLLDEFTRGMEDFERLPDLLAKLVRIGRSLGMYLFLANQDVNAAVDRLLNNIGWRIALKVARQEEMEIIDRSLPIAERGKGEGYLFSTLSPDGKPPIKFQAGYAGFVMNSKRDTAYEAFEVYEIEDDGSWEILLQVKPQNISGKEKTEQEFLLSTAEIITQEYKDLIAHPIYLDPLPYRITLGTVFENASPVIAFDGIKWKEAEEVTPWTIPIGFLDSPSECYQDVLNVNFEDKDGHLWILGAPDSGVEDTLKTLILSLALLKTPREAQIYIIEGGANRLEDIEHLPHIGAVIRVRETERIERLFQFLDEEIERRSVDASKEWPHIFLFINGYAGFRSQYDENERIAHYTQIGKSVGLHLIVTTNRRVDLWPGIANNIARRLVLYLSSTDEYFDALDVRVKPLTQLIRGRGYWKDGEVYLCQVAVPSIDISGLEQPENEYQSLSQLVWAMNNTWQGKRPFAINTLADCIERKVLLSLALRDKGREHIQVPIGVSYETLKPVLVSLLHDTPLVWAVLGERRTGKTNFLQYLATYMTTHFVTQFQVLYFAFSKNAKITTDFPFEIYYRNEIESGFRKVEKIIEDSFDKQTLLILDDAGIALGNPTWNTEIKKWFLSEKDFFVVAGDALGNFQQHLTHPLVKQIKQNHVGLVLGKDPDALYWLASVSARKYMQYRFPVGRGFWVNGGNFDFLQTPFNGEC